MGHNHNLIVKYLQIISDQEKMINELSKLNKTLLNRNNELKQQKNIYKDSALEWKHKYEAIRECLSDTYSILTKDPVINSNLQDAINIYKQNQKGGLS